MGGQEINEGGAKTNIGGQCSRWRRAWFPVIQCSGRIFQICVHRILLLARSHQAEIIIVKRLIWSSGNAFVSGADGLRFNSRAGQIERSVAKGSSPLRHPFKRSCVAGAMTQSWASQTGYKLRRNTQSIMKDLI